MSVILPEFLSFVTFIDKPFTKEQEWCHMSSSASTWGMPTLLLCVIVAPITACWQEIRIRSRQDVVGLDYSDGVSRNSATAQEWQPGFAVALRRQTSHRLVNARVVARTARRPVQPSLTRVCWQGPCSGWSERSL